jgi:hypothetical protein
VNACVLYRPVHMDTRGGRQAGAICGGRRLKALGIVGPTGGLMGAADRSLVASRGTVLFSPRMHEEAAAAQRELRSPVLLQACRREYCHGQRTRFFNTIFGLFGTPRACAVLKNVGFFRFGCSNIGRILGIRSVATQLIRRRGNLSPKRAILARPLDAGLGRTMRIVKERTLAR